MWIIPYLIYFLIAVVVAVAAYMLAPKPKQPNTPASDLNAPTVSAGRPIPVVFGTLTVKSPNVLWYGDKFVREYKVKA